MSFGSDTRALARKTDNVSRLERAVPHWQQAGFAAVLDVLATQSVILPPERQDATDAFLNES
jgi:hypothetical protein